MNLKASSLKGSFVAAMILVLGNCLKISGDALVGDINGHVDGSTPLLPTYESMHIFRNGYCKMGSSKDRSIDGVNASLIMVKAIRNSIRNYTYLDMKGLNHQAPYSSA